MTNGSTNAVVRSSPSSKRANTYDEERDSVVNWRYSNFELWQWHVSSLSVAQLTAKQDRAFNIIWVAWNHGGYLQTTQQQRVARFLSANHQTVLTPVSKEAFLNNRIEKFLIYERAGIEFNTPRGSPTQIHVSINQFTFFGRHFFK